MTIDTDSCPAPVEAGDYRAAMARLATAVHLITTDGAGGRAGFTASAVCSVSDAPPTLLVCLNRTSSAYPAFRANESLCVNTLGDGHAAIAGAFGGGTPMDERFAAAEWGQLATGAPVLAGALVAFDCRIASRTAVGSHEVLFCAVVGLAEPSDAPGLVYANRRFHTLPAASPIPAADASATVERRQGGLLAGTKPIAAIGSALRLA